jgi:1,2-dihydroxy-3-keto-5-methylthiopentene dioxygenase
MSSITVYSDSNPNKPITQTSDGAKITQILNDVGVRFERWSADQPITSGAPQDQVLAAYRKSIDKLKSECGFQTADVVSLNANHPDKDALRQKFLNEHRHSEDEVRFFVDGSGLFYLHIEDKVYVVLCEKSDLISVPANTRHWFDMGPAPRFTAIRLFTNPEGWVAQFTGDKIADRFPKYEN